MSKRDDGGPAFPRPFGTDYSEGPCNTNFPQDGMTLRDWFAGQAMAGILAADPQNADHVGLDDHRKALARAAYDMAEAMIEEGKR